MCIPPLFRPTLLALALASMAGASAARADDIAAETSAAAGPKTAAIKTITSFSQALRCMDELFLAFDKRGIVITSGGIPDETSKVKTGSKEMMISAIAKMTIKSGAFEFIDFHRGAMGVQDDLGQLFEMKGQAQTKLPDYYIRGSVTQMDDNAIRKGKGFGIALPFLDLGYSEDNSYDLLSIDMSIGDAASRRILPETSTSNTMLIVKGGKSGEGGGKIGKAGLFFNLDLTRSEGVGAAMRTLIELGMIETLGKFTRVPYWKCLDIDSTNPTMRDTAREWFDTAKENERLLFVQRKLQAINRYPGKLDGLMSPELKTAIAEYQASTQLIADGRVNFDLYYSLLDDTQNTLAALPKTPPAAAAAPGVASAVQTPPTVASVQQSMQAAPAKAADTPYQFTLQSERGSGPRYRIGEFLQASLQASHNSSAYCYYEDASKVSARIYPNQFQASPAIQAGRPVALAGQGFRIRFDRPGKERLACIGSDREIVVPPALTGFRDLTPIRGQNIDSILALFRQNNPAAVTSVLDITVQP